jgi:3D (Asp-Asp-Asp) domain-containing protein
MLSLSLIIGPNGNERPQATHERTERSETQHEEETQLQTHHVATSGNLISNHVEDNRGLTMEATAYVALCDTGCTGITATGIDVRQSHTYEGKRIIAVDPAVVPLWSEVELRYADGRTERAVAIDTGGAIDGNRIDLLVADIDTAWAFGRQDVELRIIN